MGNVGMMAAHALVNQLGMEPIGALSIDGAFDTEHVSVKDGLVTKPRLPRSVLYRWNDAPVGKGLLVLVSEAQPTANGLEIARALLDEANKIGIERVITFAAMATKIEPSVEPKIAVAATQASVLDEMKSAEISVLTEGQIGGMNGLFLGAAADRDLPGVCMLGQIPFFAAALPNPKTARAILRTFCDLRGIDIDTRDLDERAEKMEGVFTEMLEQLRQQGRLPEHNEFDIDEDEDSDEPEIETVEPRTQKGLDPKTRLGIEKLFRDARSDRDIAVKLKSELDRLGVFGEYENRFLDLFKQAR